MCTVYSKFVKSLVVSARPIKRSMHLAYECLSQAPIPTPSYTHSGTVWNYTYLALAGPYLLASKKNDNLISPLGPSHNRFMGIRKKCKAYQQQMGRKAGHVKKKRIEKKGTKTVSLCVCYRLCCNYSPNEICHWVPEVKAKQAGKTPRPPSWPGPLEQLFSRVQMHRCNPVAANLSMYTQHCLRRMSKDSASNSWQILVPPKTSILLDPRIEGLVRERERVEGTVP